MSYYTDLQKLLKDGYDYNSPEVQGLRTLHGGDRTVNVSTEKVTFARVAMSDEDKRQLANYENRIAKPEGEDELRASFNHDSQITQSDLFSK